MDLQLPADIESTVKAFLADGHFATEADVLREALASLKQREADLTAIREGIADAEAGRVRPAREILAQARTRLNRKLS